MGKKTVETTASGLKQAVGRSTLAPLATEEVTELGTYFPKSGGGSGFEPTETQLEAMNSGITAAKVAAYDTLPDEDNVKDLISDHFVAGTNVTITDNADGTQTIASTASGGFEPTETQLEAMNSGITSYWQNEFREVYNNCLPTPVYQNLAYDGGGQTGYVHEASGNYVNIPGLSTQAVLQRIFTKNNYIEYAWDVHGNHAVRYSSLYDVINPTWSEWVVIPAASAAPTAYTAPTYNTTYVDTTSDSTFGGYVVINNICYVNICVKLKSIPSSTSTYTTIATGLPKPLLPSVTVYVDIGDTGPGFAQIDRYGNGLMYKKDSDANTGNVRHFNVSYLIDTST